MSDVEWPTLDDVSVAFLSARYLGMTPEEFGALVRLAWAIACSSVNGHYSDAVPDPSLPDHDESLMRAAGCIKSEWKRVRKTVLDHLVLHRGRWRLKDSDIVRISRRTGRTPIPMAVRSVVMARDGRRCCYCGDTEGPFHFDHLFPVSRGGSDDPSNLVVACSSCNLSKNDKTLIEWSAFLRDRQ